jgi:hypothetical protein
MKRFLTKEAYVNTITDSPIIIQATSHSVSSTPSWFGEVVVIAQYLRRIGVLAKISERVHFARRRFGHYEVIDFLAVLFGYAVSGERTLEAFYERLHPFAPAFMALFGRDCLPARSTLSRFLAALTPEAVEALRVLFLEDLLGRQPDFEQQPSGLTDRAGNVWKVFDIDGTREAARPRALPQSPELPVSQRRLEDVCAPGYTGRKRGEIVRTRTTVLQAHSSQWLGTFGNPGNGEYRKELRRAVEMIGSYLKARQFPDKHALLRLDGLYGTGAVLADLRGFAFVMRSKEYGLLDLPVVQARLHLPADQQFSRPESTLIRMLYDCPEVAVGSSGLCCRLIVATHPAGPTKKRIGIERDGLIYELFLTKLPQEAFTAADVVALYLHRGAFETTLSDEDMEQEPDRWCSHAACGQEVWQIVSQWVWNLRLELGHQLEPEPLRTTEFAPAFSPAKEPTAPACGYAPAVVALPFKQGRFSGCDFALQPDGTLRCPAGQALFATEERREADGSLRLVYAARISHCRDCRLREQCQWHGGNTQKPRRGSRLLHPLQVGSAPLLWRDWSRRQHRRACMQLLRHQRVDVHLEPLDQPGPAPSPPILSRAQRAHYRLSWEERFARNKAASTIGRCTITLFGVPESFAASLGLLTA